jgi:general secretion pathway protein G
MPNLGMSMEVHTPDYYRPNPPTVKFTAPAVDSSHIRHAVPYSLEGLGAIMNNCKLSNARVNRRGFTVVEILIVVIILATLAAIVVPQFSDAGTDARKNTLTAQLQTIREQIGYYQLQHNGQLPKLITGGGWAVLTQYTSMEGTVNPTGGVGTDYPFGPYLQYIPANPLTDPAAATRIAADAATGTGWIYNETNGKICGTGSVATQYFNETDGTDTPINPVQ